MHVNKGYKLLQFLNRQHHWLERCSLALAAWVGVLCSTRSVTLATGVYRRFRNDQFFTAFRQSARYARQLWRGFDFVEDPFFDFTRDTSAAELQALEQDARRRVRRGGDDADDALTDLLYILGAQIHAGIRAGQPVDALVSAYYQTADQALARIGQASPQASQPKPSGPSRVADFSKQDAVQALSDINRVLPLDRWPWFVMSGTFLGLHREGGFLAHDYDIDLGIKAEQIDIDQLLAYLQSQSLFVVKTIDSHVSVDRDAQGRRYLNSRISLVKLCHVNGLQIDLFVHHTDGDTCWHGSLIHRWENSPFDLVCREMEGIAVNAPADADRYLTENYGDWRTPVTDFDCTTGTPNLSISRNFISVALFIKRLDYFSRHQPQAADKTYATLLRDGVLAGTPDALYLALSL